MIWVFDWLEYLLHRYLRLQSLLLGSKCSIRIGTFIVYTVSRDVVLMNWTVINGHNGFLGPLFLMVHLFHTFDTNLHVSYRIGAFGRCFGWPRHDRGNRTTTMPNCPCHLLPRGEGDRSRPREVAPLARGRILDFATKRNTTNSHPVVSNKRSDHKEHEEAIHTRWRAVA